MSVDDLHAAAVANYRKCRFVQAQDLCRATLARNPRHVPSLVLLGDMVQQEGRNKSAVKLLSKALALDPCDTAAHDTIAIAYQALGEKREANRHYTIAIALGLRDAELLVKRSAAVAPVLTRLAGAWPRRLPLAELLGMDGARPLAAEPMLLALLQSSVIFDIELQRLLTVLRRGLLMQVAECAGDTAVESIEFFGALAQQCFLNEYIFASDDAESRALERVQDRVNTALEGDDVVASLEIIVSASYSSLQKLPQAKLLLERRWPEALEPVLTQQIREPLEEQADLDRIPSLTPVDDMISLQVQSQYEENPYPRWNTLPPFKPTTLAKKLREDLGVSAASWSECQEPVDILIAGCGTGQHSIATALRYPNSRIIAIDISRASLAYARRKSRALGATNIEYAQADILKLQALERRFDVIEAIGVLHHLLDPLAGWRLLLSLLRPNGLMQVGLYSSLAHRGVNAARAFAVEHGYGATANDIRNCRQDLIQNGYELPFRDFSSTSGCRDLLFHVMEHQFTIPEIGTFVGSNGLDFLGFTQLPSETLAQFRRRYPDAQAGQDLTAWHAFEQMHPLTFAGMYQFWIKKTG